MKISRETLRKSRSSQDLQDVEKKGVSSRLRHQEDEIHLPQIGKSHNEVIKEGVSKRVSHIDKQKWLDGGGDKARKRSGSNLEDPYKTLQWSNENALTFASNHRNSIPGYHKIPLKDCQNEKGDQSSERLGKFELGSTDYAFQEKESVQRTQHRNEAELGKSQEYSSNDNNDDGNASKRKIDDGTAVGHIQRRDTEQTLKSGTFSSLYNSQGRDLESIFSHNFLNSKVSTRPPRKISLNGVDIEQLPSRRSGSIRQQLASGETSKNNVVDNKGSSQRNRRKDGSKKYDKTTDTDNDFIQKVRVHDNTGRDKRFSLGKFTLSRSSNLQRLERPSSNLRDHIRREEARYNQHQSETKRMLFEKWLQGTNEYLYHISHEGNKL